MRLVAQGRWLDDAVALRGEEAPAPHPANRITTSTSVGLKHKCGTALEGSAAFQIRLQNRVPLHAYIWRLMGDPRPFSR